MKFTTRPTYLSSMLELKPSSSNLQSSRERRNFADFGTARSVRFSRLSGAVGQIFAAARGGRKQDFRGRRPRRRNLRVRRTCTAKGLQTYRTKCKTEVGTYLPTAGLLFDTPHAPYLPMWTANPATTDPSPGKEPKPSQGREGSPTGAWSPVRVRRQGVGLAGSDQALIRQL